MNALVMHAQEPPRAQVAAGREPIELRVRDRSIVDQEQSFRELLGVEADPVDVTGGKHMEAIREGAEDYELLARLRERIADVAGSSEFTWSASKDRSAADAVRIEIEELLDALR